MIPSLAKLRLSTCWRRRATAARSSRLSLPAGVLARLSGLGEPHVQATWRLNHSEAVRFAARVDTAFECYQQCERYQDRTKF